MEAVAKTSPAIKDNNISILKLYLKFSTKVVLWSAKILHRLHHYSHIAI